jgi:hypothetical protein
MKESSTSLRLFFGVVGVLYFLSTGLVVALMGSLGLLGALGDLFTGSPVALLTTALNIAWSLGYLYFAFTLPSYLNPQRVKYVKIFLLVPLASTLLWAAIGFLTTGKTDFITPVIGVLVTWYLFANVQRLSNPPAPAQVQ